MSFCPDELNVAANPGEVFSSAASAGNAAASTKRQNSTHTHEQLALIDTFFISKRRRRSAPHEVLMDQSLRFKEWHGPCA